MKPLGHIPKIELAMAMLSLGVGAALLGLKFTAYWLTGSSAIFSDAVESIVNVMASAFALWALSVSHMPADDDHPYGHGKIEFLSAGFEGAMILIAAVLIFIRTIDLFFFREIRAERLDIGLVLIVIATLINGLVGLLLVRVGRRQGALTLEADGIHLLSDAVTSVAVLVALVIVKVTGYKWADPVVAMGIAIYIATTGLRLIRTSVAGLMDKQDSFDQHRLVNILNSHIPPGPAIPTICSFHKLKLRHSGRYHWVDFHVVVPAKLSVSEGHEIASSIEHEMQSMLGHGNATAHIEPCTAAGCAHCGVDARSKISPAICPTFPDRPPE